MFGFDEEHAAEIGSEGRFQEREQRFTRDAKPAPKVRHRGWWLLHNNVAHPLLGLFPCGLTFLFHDWTSRKLNHHE